MEDTPGRQQGSKFELAKLAAASSAGFVSPELAGRVLGLPRVQAARKLAALTEQGWLSRIRRGLYFVLPLDAASDRSTTLPDPWAAASVLYKPCYIAGWSAAEHWGLTEQLFRSTFVATAASIRERDDARLGASFHLTKVARTKIKELASVWRSSIKVSVSGAERTIIDAAVDPAWVGGVRHLAEILCAYRDRETPRPETLIAPLRSFGTGAAAKRLGYLCERFWPAATAVIEECLALRSRGNIKLDPYLGADGKLITRWGLWENAVIPPEGHS